MSRIQINLGLIGNVIMGARLRQHRLLEFVFVGNIISEPLRERSTLQSGPQISPLSVVGRVTLDATSRRHCLNICQLLWDIEARHHPFDAPTPGLVRTPTIYNFLTLREKCGTIVRGITSF